MSLFRPSSSVSVWLITNQLTKKCSVYWLAMHTATQYYVTVFVSVTYAPMFRGYRDSRHRVHVAAQN